MIDRSAFSKGQPFLKAGDFKSGASFTIETFEEFDYNGEHRCLLRLAGVEQPFGLNMTNLDNLLEKFGNDEKKWRGKKIKLLHVMAPNPQKGGKSVKSIRIE